MLFILSFFFNYGILLCFSITLLAQDYTSNNLFSVNKTADGSPVVINHSNKYNLPSGALDGAQSLQFSLTRGFDYLHHPSGSEIFGGGSLAEKLDQFLNCLKPLTQAEVAQRLALKRDNYFSVYFMRLQITILYELYQYLLAIYTNLLLTPVTSMREYLLYEEQYGLNNKTLIIAHLMNIIEEQMNEAVRSRFPALPSSVASRLGPMLLRNDYGADLYMLLNSPELVGINDPIDVKFYNERRDLYIYILSTYISLFNEYTALIEQGDSKDGNKCVALARSIRRSIDRFKPQLISQESFAPIRVVNPSLFMYNEETIRSLSIIPELARTIPLTAQRIDWPERVVADAVKGSPLRNRAGAIISKLPRAYFVNNQGDKTTAYQSATHLFVHIPTANQMYAQEIKKQPEWLNSYKGVVSMTRACLGDYAVIFESYLEQEAILDPCTACIVMSAGMQAGILSQAMTTRCSECLSYIKKSATPSNTINKKPTLPAWTPDLSMAPPLLLQ